MESVRAFLVRHGDAVAPRLMGTARELRDTVVEYLARDERRAQLVSEPWFIDRLAMTESRVEANGWAFPPPPGVPRPHAAFTLNGEPFDECTIDVRRPDIGHAYWQRLGAKQSGFTLVSHIGMDERFRDGYMEIRYWNSPTSLPHGLQHDWFCADPRSELPLPDAKQRFRVLGNEDDLGFRLSGATDFKRIARAIHAVTGARFEDFGHVLDWGSGCGRIARYAAPACGGELVGCDIDAENVEWCNAHLPGTYVATTMNSPLPFPDGHFDLVYGVSVFTHFGPHLQDLWLAELRRVVRPGGLVLVTTHGRTAIDYGDLRPHAFIAIGKAVEANGIHIAGKNEQLDGAVKDADEYVNVFHSAAYIRAHWAKWFRILEIIPGYIYTHDLVVLERAA